MGDTDILAAFDADERFVDLVLSDDAGLRFRASGGWQHYQPGDDSLDGLEVIEVEERFVTFVDRAMVAGTRPSRANALKFSPDDGYQSEEDES